MKIFRIIVLILAILFGIFMIVYGEHDDSPGGQFLGLALAIIGVVFIVRIRRKSLK